MAKKEGKPGESTISSRHSASVPRSNSKFSGSKSSSSSATATTLYHPSIFRYTCTGKLSLDSRNGGQNKASAGVCYGIQSTLEHIDHWRLSTREEAIKQFEYKSSLGIGSGEDDYYNSAGNDPSDDFGASSAHAEQAVYLSNVLLYPPPATEGEDHDDDADQPRKRNRMKETMVSRKNTDGSTTITPQQENWSCYGSTEVDLLVLRPQNAKDESIVGVASYCAPGVTVRDLAISPTNIGIGSETGGRERTTTVRLGILEIVYATVLEGYDGEGSANGEQGNAKGSGGSSGKNTIEGESTKGWISAPTQVISSGKKILNHMSINGRILYESAQENYPTRTYEASQRIANEFRKTLDRTTALMKKVASFALFRDDWDDDDN
mmetsp:Transcript_11993/g.30416  ORF Transcript_11993/g.30416 Transcript_11993/m.30416 type:complete len:379 (+) Transcript_11993:158-1294(+)